jgi:putative ABC transport system permease protein
MKFLFFAFKSLSRNPVRTTLTLLGVGVAMFLFTGVVSLDQGMRRMLANSAGDDTLVVFDKYQGCPPLSKLPTSYEAQVAELSGVAETTPTLFLLSACSRATDLVAVHGIEPEKFRRFRKIDIPQEQYRAFSQERGAAIVGENVARTYGWRIGQAVTLQKLGDISFTVRGIFRAPGSSLENAILVDLDYLQFATNQTGKMTLLLVKVSNSARAGAVAERVDALFSSSASPTKTTPERSFIASAVSGVTGIVEFSRWLGYMALGIILVGVGNSLAMTIRDRTREFAILKTLGFRRPQLLRLVIFEAVLASLLGGALGAGLAWLAVNRSNLSLSVEGFTIAPHVTLELALWAVALAGVLGTVAAVLPAINASRLKIVQALREVD